MSRIIVTGGLGFIGSNFIRLILNENLCDAVLNIDKQTYAGNPENLSGLDKTLGMNLLNRISETKGL